MVHDRVTIMELLSSARRRWVALVVVCIGQLMIVVDA